MSSPSVKSILHSLSISINIPLFFKDLTLEDGMPRGSLGLLTGHNILRSPENTVQLVLLLVSGEVGEGFVVSNYQPILQIQNINIKILFIKIKQNSQPPTQKL